MKAELLSHFGDDLMVVNAARVSYGKSKGRLDEKDAKLIKFLVEHGHTSPFRHPQLHFRIQCPIFVERQLFKHQVGLTANSISGRYVDFSDEYWVPEQLRLQSKDSKQGSSGDMTPEDNEHFITRINCFIAQCKELYDDMVVAGVAKEQCRVILPLCLETQFIWTGSLAAFLHLWKLRLKPDAQKETRDIAQMMLEEVRNLPGNPFRLTLEAFGL
ncbi:FAD-dependent thymidylate synthase [bacterium]|nr:FAD-dependent thymidylate synthase [bacterium]